MAPVSETRDRIGKTALGMLSALLVALLSWGGVQLWASKLDVSVYADDHARLALHAQIDSLRLAHIERQVFRIACATRQRTPCPRGHNGR